MGASLSVETLDVLCRCLARHELQSLASVTCNVLLQALAALRVHGAAMEAGLPQQSMQAEMAAFLVNSATLWAPLSAVAPLLSSAPLLMLHVSTEFLTR